MPRNFKSTARYTKADPKFGSMVATKLINKLMQEGKKSTAMKVFYRAVETAGKRLGLPDEEHAEVFMQALENVKPRVEVRSKRVGGANYQVPIEVKRHRQQSLGIRVIIDNARKKKGKPMFLRLAEELVDAYRNTGASVTWKENTHKMADANRAYSHFAW
ncbi:MAG: 30S ribosomal protein S7 [Planctomycetes bacterium]|nr:30S ribosomal protein S7 [Planctomycetota bacterium]